MPKDSRSDQDTRRFATRTGEFSDKNEVAFNKHMRRLSDWIKGKGDYEPCWYAWKYNFIKF